MDNEKQIYDNHQSSDFNDRGIDVSRLEPCPGNYVNAQSLFALNSHQVILFTKGSGYHTIDFQKFTVKPYQICLIMPDQVYSRNFDDEIDGYVVNFSISFFQSLLLSSYLDTPSFFTKIVSQNVLQIPNDHTVDFKITFEEMLREFLDDKKLKFDFIRILLLRILILTSRFSDDELIENGSSYNRALLKSFIHLIELNFMNLRLPKEYAELLYITPNHLNALCNDMTGASAGHIIRNRVALEAKRQLIDPDMAVSDIAAKLRFGDNSFFTRFFKKQVGLTPEEFRKSILKS